MVYSKSYPMPTPVMSRQTLILATMCCWNCRRTTIIATGQAIGTPRTRTQPCQTPKHRTIRAATENGVDTAAGTSKSSLACVLNSRESGHRRVTTTTTERGAGPAVSSNSMSATARKERQIQPYPAPQAEKHRMTTTQRRVNAIRRESGDNRARFRSTVLRILSHKARQEQRRPYLATQA